MSAFYKKQKRAAAQLYYRTLMINWLYDAKCNYRELAERPSNVAIVVVAALCSL